MKASFLSRLTLRQPLLVQQIAREDEALGAQRELRETVESVFNTLGQLAEGGASQTPEVVYHQFEHALQRVQRFAEQSGLGREQCEDIRYALVAAIDEACIGAGGALRDYWMTNLLQLKHFNENVAGEVFFQRLDRLLTGYPRPEVLEVYYLCLLFGFRGRHGGPGGQIELSELAKRAREGLQRTGYVNMEAELSPAGARPAEAAVQRGHNAKMVVAAGCLALASMLFYCCCWIWLDRAASDVARNVQCGLSPEDGYCSVEAR